MNMHLAKRGPAKEARLADLKFMVASEAERKALGDDIPEGYIAGWASTPDLDSYRDVVLPGAFDESIASKGLTGPKSIKLLVGHNWEKPAGVIKVLETRGNRLWIEAQMNLNISYAKDFYEAAKSAGGLNFSVGFFLKEYNIRKDSGDREYFELVKGELFEVSVVPFPGNEECTMEFVKSANILLKAEALEVSIEEVDDTPPKTLGEFEKALVANGLVKSRNEARLITLEVKSALHLFSPKAKEQAPPVLTEQTSTDAPVADEDLQKAMSRLTSMKARLAPK